MSEIALTNDSDAQNSIPLDIMAMDCIIKTWNTCMPLRIGSEYLAGILFFEPFKITVAAGGAKPNTHLERTIKKWWMPWIREVYKWSQCFGIVPYRFIQIESGDLVPTVPEYGSGIIHTYKVDHRSHYLWFWLDEETIQRKPDRNMLWIKVQGSTPSWSGKIQTLMAALCESCENMESIMESINRAFYQASRPATAFEFKPPSRETTTQSVIEPSFGEAASNLTDIFSQSVKRTRNMLRIEEHEAILKRAEDLNHGAISSLARERMDAPTKPLSERERAAMDMKIPSWQTNRIDLPAHIQVKSLSDAKVATNPTDMIRRFDTLAAAVAGYPLELVLSMHAQRSANVDGLLLTLNERIKNLMAILSEHIREAWAIAYSDVHRNLKNRALKKLTSKCEQFSDREVQEIVGACETYDDIRVEMNYTPLISHENLRQLWQDGILTHEDFSRFALQRVNIDPKNARKNGEKFALEAFQKPKPEASKSPPNKKQKSKAASSTI